MSRGLFRNAETGGHELRSVGRLQEVGVAISCWQLVAVRDFNNLLADKDSVDDEGYSYE